MTVTSSQHRITIQENRFAVGKLIGNTPLYELTSVWKHKRVRILAKLEWCQLGGSVKSRPAFYIINHAIECGELHKGKQLLDASSGNTGIAYASIGAALGIPVTICLPENASKERKEILNALGANIEYTSRFEGTDGAQTVAREIASMYPEKFYYADQYNNRNNWRAHFETTANEIWSQTNGSITHFVAGLGTTGTFSGISKRLRHLNPAIEFIGLQPDNPMHGLEGWKHLETAKVPGIFKPELVDRTLTVDTLEAYDMLKEVAQKEGLLISPSAAANLVGAIKVAEQLESGVVVTTFSDNADKYSEVIQQIL
jgi:cysteine synthase B